MAGRFEGWKGDFRGYFLGLQANNTKSFFEAHRKQYETDVKAPLASLLAELEPEFGAARMARPNRDIRFSADKSPYKTNIYASTAAGGYVSLDANSLVAAGGRYMLDPEQLARYRAAVAAEASGEELDAIVAALRKRGYEIGGQELKRVPSPYSSDHPRGELLCHKRLIYWKRWDVGPWIATSAVRQRVAGAWRDGADLGKWLSRHLDR